MLVILQFTVPPEGTVNPVQLFWGVQSVGAEVSVTEYPDPAGMPEMVQVDVVEVVVKLAQKADPEEV